MTKTAKYLAVFVLALAFAPSFLRAAQEPERKPDAIVNLTQGSFALGIGFSWGSGTLTYKGKDYPISVHGVSLGKVGGSSATARGNVYKLKDLKDFDGHYVSRGASLTLAGGRSAEGMQNQHGVVVYLYSTTKGLDVALARSGVDLKIKK